MCVCLFVVVVILLNITPTNLYSVVIRLGKTCVRNRAVSKTPTPSSTLKPLVQSESVAAKTSAISSLDDAGFFSRWFGWDALLKRISNSPEN